MLVTRDMFFLVADSHIPRASMHYPALHMSWWVFLQPDDWGESFMTYMKSLRMKQLLYVKPLRWKYCTKRCSWIWYVASCRKLCSLQYQMTIMYGLLRFAIKAWLVSQVVESILSSFCRARWFFLGWLESCLPNRAPWTWRCSYRRICRSGSKDKSSLFAREFTWWRQNTFSTRWLTSLVISLITFVCIHAQSSWLAVFQSVARQAWVYFGPGNDSLLECLSHSICNALRAGSMVCSHE